MGESLGDRFDFRGDAVGSDQVCRQKCIVPARESPAPVTVVPAE